MNRRKLWQIFAFLFSLIGLGIIFSRLDINTLWDALQHLHWWNVLLSFLIAVGVQFISAYRSQILLNHRLSFFTACTSLFIGNFVSSFVPLRMGEVVRTVLIKRKADIPLSTGASAIVLSQVLDIFGIGLMAFMLLLWLPSQAEFQQWAWTAAGIVLVALLPLIFLSHQSMMQKLVKHERLAPIIANVSKGLDSLQSPGRLIWAIVVTISFWMGTALATWVLLPDFTGEASWLLAIAVGVAGGIGRLLPALPGSIGTLDVAVLLSLRLFGVPEDIALVLVMLIRLRYTLSISLLGLLALAAENTSLAETQKLVTEEQLGQ